MCTGLNCVKSDLAEKQDDVEEGGEEGEGDDGCEEEGGEESDRFGKGDGTGEGAESENQRAAAFVESNGYGDPEVVERRQGDERADREANGKAETDKQNTNDMSGAHLESADSTVSHSPSPSHTDAAMGPIPTSTRNPHSSPNNISNHSRTPDNILLPAVDSMLHTTGLQSTRGTRKRKVLSHLADCLCGSRVSAQEIERTDGVVQCRKPVCETEWVSIPFYFNSRKTKHSRERLPCSLHLRSTILRVLAALR